MPPEYESKAAQAVQSAITAIQQKADSLEVESKRMRWNHQVLTVLTILFGVSAPALVTYTPPMDDFAWVWKIAAIVVTAFASASATIRSVLRFNERYSNSALKSIALLSLASEVDARREDVLSTVRDEHRERKLYELTAWARRQMLEIVRAYVESEVAASTQAQLTLEAPPKTEDARRIESPTPEFVQRTT